jgi:hypothetical protein
MTRPTASFAQKTHEKLHINSPPRERKSTAKIKPRRSMAKLEDDKENVTHTNGVEDHSAPETGPDSNTIADGAALQTEVSAQPLAAGK